MEGLHGETHTQMLHRAVGEGLSAAAPPPTLRPGQARPAATAGQALIYSGITHIYADRQPHGKEHMPDFCITSSLSKLRSVNYDKDSLACSRQWKKHSVLYATRQEPHSSK